MQLPLQQSKKWEKFEQSLGEKTFYEKTDDFCFLAILKETKLGNYLYLPYGPYLKTEKGAKNAYKALEKLAKELSVIFIRIEPQDREKASWLLKRPNIVKSKDLNPERTWILDMTPEKAKLISNFTQGTRTCYNQAPKKGITIEVTKDPEKIDELVKLQHKLAHEKGIGTYSEDYLKKELEQDFAVLYLSHYNDNGEDKVIGASLFFDFKNTRYYMQSATDYDYRRLPANVAILTSAIFDAKEKGMKYFDFWGIAPEDAGPDHPWSGFTRFKKSFGGFPVDYCGTYDLVLDKSKYNFYNFARKINRKLRKLLH